MHEFVKTFWHQFLTFSQSIFQGVFVFKYVNLISLRVKTLPSLLAMKLGFTVGFLQFIVDKIYCLLAIYFIHNILQVSL